MTGAGSPAPTLGAPACREVALAINESLAGTAPSGTRRWLLIEHPAAWGSHVVNDILDQEIREGLRTTQITPVAVRTATWRTLEGPLRLWWVDMHDQHIRVWTCTDVGARNDAIALVARTGNAPARAQDWLAPMLLVCTNGKRDACCAVVGRSIINEVPHEDVDIVFESSHLGGHRFAGVTLVLPSGYMHRCRDGAHCSRIVEAQRQQRIEPDGLRGRCGLAPVEQCAEISARGVWQDWRIQTSVAFEHGPDVITATSDDGRELTLTVERGTGPVRPESCGAEGKPMNWVRTVARASH